MVTGATGFIGQELIDKLLEQEHEVYAIERYMTARYVLGRRTTVNTYFVDLRDYFAVKKAVAEIMPEVVMHLASISPVAYSYDHPQEVIDTNFKGTVNLAEACLREVPHFKQFLFASTSETYGNGSCRKYEHTQQNPNSPYAVSKVASEKYLLYMKDAYNFPITILRPFNTYGRKDNSHFFVERTIVQMLTQDTVRLGDPKTVRDLLYVDDHVSAYLTCLNNGKAIGEIFNFCTGHSWQLESIASKIADMIGFKGKVLWNTIPKRPLDIVELWGSPDKAKSVLGWYNKVSLEEGLKRTIEYWTNKLSMGRSNDSR